MCADRSTHELPAGAQGGPKPKPCRNSGIQAFLDISLRVREATRFILAAKAQWIARTNRIVQHISVKIRALL